MNARLMSASAGQLAPLPPLYDSSATLNPKFAIGLAAIRGTGEQGGRARRRDVEDARHELIRAFRAEGCL